MFDKYRELVGKGLRPTVQTEVGDDEKKKLRMIWQKYDKDTGAMLDTGHEEIYEDDLRAHIDNLKARLTAAEDLLKQMV